MNSISYSNIKKVKAISDLIKALKEKNKKLS